MKFTTSGSNNKRTVFFSQDEQHYAHPAYLVERRKKIVRFFNSDEQYGSLFRRF